VHGAAEVELDLATGELVGDRPRVGQRPREPIELGDDKLVAGAARGERFTEARTRTAGAGKPWST
jgi:hypothetical protein